MGRPVLSLVIPVRDEEEAIPDVHTRLLDLLAKLGQEQEAEVVFVNDGSRDLSGQVLRGLAAVEPRYRILSLSRPFGPAAATTAGLAYARGQAVVALPTALVDRADLVLGMVQCWRDGYDVVHLRARPSAGGLGALLRRLAQAMLPVEAPLEEGAARLMSRRAVVALRAIGESHRFVRGVVAWIGFRQTQIEYDAEGPTEPLWAVGAAAWSAVTAFSTVPLHLATYFGLALGAFALFLGIVSTLVVLAGSTLPGWFAGAVIAALLTSGQLVAIGVLGTYVGKIYDEVKRRPLYVVRERVNLVAPDDDIVEEPALAPPVLDSKASVPPAAGTLLGIPAPGAPLVTAPMHAVAKTAPMPQMTTSSFPPPAPTTASAAATAPTELLPAVTAPSQRRSSAPPVPASLKTAPVATVRAERTSAIPTMKPGTLEVPTLPQPSAAAPTAREPGEGAARPSAPPAPGSSRPSAAPTAPTSSASKPPPVPKRTKSE